MLELLAAMVALGLSAAASSSGLITTARVLLPDAHRALPWWFAAGSFVGYSAGALLASSALGALGFDGTGANGSGRSRPTELVLGIGLLLCAIVLIRIRVVASTTVLRVFRFYGRVRLDKGWIPRRLLLQGVRNVLRPRGLAITLTAGLLLQRTTSTIGADAIGAAVYGASSAVVIVALIAVFQRAPERNRLRFERARDWITANATIVAAGVAAATGTVLILRAASG